MSIMQSPSKTKQMLLSPKGDSSRIFSSLYSPKPNTTAKDIFPHGSPTSRDAQILQKAFANTPVTYKAKKPNDITDGFDSEKLSKMNLLSTTYESRTQTYYDQGNNNDLLGTAPFLSTRLGPQGDDEKRELEGEPNNSHRALTSGQKMSNNASYLAEKVYSMKLKGPGIMGTLMPLSKAKSPTNNVPSSTKGASVNNISGFKEEANYSSLTINAKSGATLYNDAPENGMLSKKNGTNSHKSLGKSLNEGKAANATTNAQLQRDNSWGKIRKTQNKTYQSEKKAPADKGRTTTSHYSVFNSPQNKKSKESAASALKSKLESFVFRITTTLWQANQRNKRIVLITLLEDLQKYKLRINSFIERKETVMKAKYFCQWQQFLLEVNLERQRLEQEKAEEMKEALAGMFHERRLLKKAFQVFQTLDDPKQKSPKAYSGAYLKSLTKSYRQPSINLVKSPISKRRVTYTDQTGNQNKPKITQSNEKNNDQKRNSQVAPQTQSSATSRSQSVGKILKEIKTAATTATRPSNQVLVNKKVLNKSAVTDSPGRKDSTTTNNANNAKTLKQPVRFYEPSEIEETTEFSQSPEKPIRNNAAYFEKTPQKKREAFDSILAEILHTAEHTNDEGQIGSLDGSNSKSSRKEMLENILKANNFVLDQASPSKTARERETPVKSERGSAKESLTARPRNESGELNKSFNNNKKTVSIFETPPRPASSFAQTNVIEEEDHQDADSLKKALAYRRRRLLQIPFIWLLASVSQTKEEFQEKNELAEIHYQNNLKIKSLSGLLQNYVKAFKENQISQDHYDNKLLITCFATWKRKVPELKIEKEDSEAAYNDIVNRFRFIVLTEKALRQWKDLVITNANARLAAQKKKK